MYRVMLVEDDRAIRYVYSRLETWGRQGFYIECEAGNGSQAITLLKNHPVDIIFTDIRMPLMNGIVMMKEIKKTFPDVLFVLISSYNEFEYAREGLKLGALDYISKPLEEKELEEVLRKADKILKTQEREGMFQKLCKLYENQVSQQDSLLTSVCDYLEENLNQNVTMEEVAEELNLNKDYLGKQIKGRTGQSFRTIYNQLKMEYAKEMLKKGNLKVYEISEKLGYTSADYFTLLFKKIVGMPPAEYKK